MKSQSNGKPRAAQPGATRCLRRCPRCRGPMSVEFDPRVGHVRDCLNCGHIEYFVVCPPGPAGRDPDRLRPEGRHALTSVTFSPVREA